MLDIHESPSELHTVNRRIESCLMCLVGGHTAGGVTFTHPIGTFDIVLIAARFDAGTRLVHTFLHNVKRNSVIRSRGKSMTR